MQNLWNKARHTWCGLFLIGISVFGAQPLQAAVITREEAVKALSDQVLFMGELKDLSEDEKRALLSDCELERLAGELLPERMVVRSERNRDHILQAATLSFDKNDLEYSRLLIKKALMDLSINVTASEMLSPLEEKDREDLVAVVEALTASALDSMNRHLGETIPRENIDEAVMSLRKLLIRDIDNPLTAALKVNRILPEDVERLGSVFEKRLRMTAHLAKERVNAAQSRAGAEAVRTARVEREYDRILEEVLAPLEREIMGQTADRRILEIQADDIAPGYSELIGRIDQARRRFRREEVAAMEEQRRKTEVQNALNADPEELVSEVTAETLSHDLDFAEDKKVPGENPPANISRTAKPLLLSDDIQSAPLTGKPHQQRLWMWVLGGMVVAVAVLIYVLSRHQKKTVEG